MARKLPKQTKSGVIDSLTSEQVGDIYRAFSAIQPGAVCTISQRDLDKINPNIGEDGWQRLMEKAVEMEVIHCSEVTYQIARRDTHER